MFETKIAAAYIRVSTDDQMEISPESQLSKIREYAEKNNLILSPQYIFHDDGISGRAADKRPGFQKMIAAAKDSSHPFDVIVVWKFSRFARNQEESIFYKSILRSKCKVDVVSVSEPLIAGPFGSLIERIIEWMDEFYSIRLSEEVKRSMTVNAKKGNLQSTPSFGYRVENHTLVIVPEEAEIVREIFRRFIAGDAMYALAKSINERGIRTHRGGAFENRTVDYILNNPVYIGKLRWTPTGKARRDFKNKDSIIADAAHEAIIDLSTWDAAQSRIAELKTTYRKYSKPSSGRKHWLCGVARCSSCGNTMVFAQPNSLQCNAYLKGACKVTHRITIPLMEEAFIQQLKHDLTFAEFLGCNVQRKSAAPDLQNFQQQRSRIVSRMDRLRDAYLDGVEPLDSYRASRSKLQAQLDELDLQIAALNSVDLQDSAAALRKAIASVLETLQSTDATTAQKYDSVCSIVQNCYFDKAEMLLTISYRLVL